jgi:hypothetical protein
VRNAEYVEDETILEVGKAEKSDGVAADETVYAAVLWIPDPTERRGWRDLWIERKHESKPKTAGFRSRR